MSVKPFAVIEGRGGGVTKKVNREKGEGNGEGVMKVKNIRIYHLQKGRGAPGR